MELRCTPFAVGTCRVVKTLEALSCSGVTITTDTKVNVVVTITFATLAILFLEKEKVLSENHEQLF